MVTPFSFDYIFIIIKRDVFTFNVIPHHTYFTLQCLFIISHRFTTFATFWCSPSFLRNLTMIWTCSFLASPLNPITFCRGFDLSHRWNITFLAWSKSWPAGLQLKTHSRRTLRRTFTRVFIVNNYRYNTTNDEIYRQKYSPIRSKCIVHIPNNKNQITKNSILG